MFNGGNASPVASVACPIVRGTRMKKMTTRTAHRTPCGSSMLTKAVERPSGTGTELHCARIQEAGLGATTNPRETTERAIVMPIACALATTGINGGNPRNSFVRLRYWSLLHLPGQTRNVPVEKAGTLNHDCVGDPIQTGDNVYFQFNSDRLFKVSGKERGEDLKTKGDNNYGDYSEATKPSESFYLWSVPTNSATHLLPGQQSDQVDKKCYEDCLTRKGTNEMNCKIMPGDEVMFSNIDGATSAVSWWQCDGDAKNLCVMKNCPGATHNVADHAKCERNRFWIQNLRSSRYPIRHGDYIGLRFTPLGSKQEKWFGCYDNNPCYAKMNSCPKKYEGKTDHMVDHGECEEVVLRVIAPARTTKYCTTSDVAGDKKKCFGDPIYAGDKVLLKRYRRSNNPWLSASSEWSRIEQVNCPGKWHNDVMTNCMGEIFNIWSKANHLGIY